MNFFFVFQNKSFNEEKDGGYLWAPQGSCSHWKNMLNVRKGDIIFHSYYKKIAAISVALTDCYEASQPEELKSNSLWGNNGWKVDCQYYLIQNPIVTSNHKDDILQLQPVKYAPFNKLGKGNTGYLFNCNKELAEFLFKKSSIKNKIDLKSILSRIMLDINNHVLVGKDT